MHYLLAIFLSLFCKFLQVSHRMSSHNNFIHLFVNGQLGGFDTFAIIIVVVVAVIINLVCFDFVLS